MWGKKFSLSCKQLLNEKKKHWYMTIQEIKFAFSNMKKSPMFEVAVTTKDGETDYIVFDISIEGDNFVAAHEPLTVLQQESDKVAFVSLEIEDGFSLDEILGELYEVCINSIADSDFFTLCDD